MASAKSPQTDRSHGGPGSSHESKEKRGEPRPRTKPDQPTNPRESRVSGGGGERDNHHTHDPHGKK